MNEFVTLCGRDRVPIIWFQDTTGIDVGDIAEKAELLGLGQSLIYSIQQTDVPHDAGGPAQGHGGGALCHGRPHGQPAQRLYPGVATTEIYVMHGETAAAASFLAPAGQRKRRRPPAWTRSSRT